MDRRGSKKNPPSSSSSPFSKKQRWNRYTLNCIRLMEIWAAKNDPLHSNWTVPGKRFREPATAQLARRIQFVLFLARDIFLSHMELIEIIFPENFHAQPPPSVKDIRFRIAPNLSKTQFSAVYGLVKLCAEISGADAKTVDSVFTERNALASYMPVTRRRGTPALAEASRYFDTIVPNISRIHDWCTWSGTKSQMKLKNVKFAHVGKGKGSQSETFIVFAEMKGVPVVGKGFFLPSETPIVDTSMVTEIYIHQKIIPRLIVPNKSGHAASPHFLPAFHFSVCNTQKEEKEKGSNSSHHQERNIQSARSATLTDLTKSGKRGDRSPFGPTDTRVYYVVWQLRSEGTLIKDMPLGAAIPEIYVQLIYTVQCMVDVGFCHNDMHTGNVFVVTLPVPQRRHYVFSTGKKGEFAVCSLTSRYHAEIYDWDRAVLGPAHVNRGILNTFGLSTSWACNQGSGCADFNPVEDAWFLTRNLTLKLLKENKSIGEQFIQALSPLYDFEILYTKSKDVPQRLERTRLGLKSNELLHRYLSVYNNPLPALGARWAYQLSDQEIISKLAQKTFAKTSNAPLINRFGITVPVSPLTRVLPGVDYRAATSPHQILTHFARKSPFHGLNLGKYFLFKNKDQVLQHIKTLKDPVFITPAVHFQLFGT